MKLSPPLFLSAVVAACALLAPRDERDPAPAPRTVFLLRHAEADAATPERRDPSLTERGAQRAEALAALLAPTGVTHLAASPYARTRETLAPLARALELEPAILEPLDLRAYAALLEAAPPGSVAVICGHSNTIPALLEHLGGDATGIAVDERAGERRIDHDTYDRLFQLVLSADPERGPHTLELALP